MTDAERSHEITSLHMHACSLNVGLQHVISSAAQAGRPGHSAPFQSKQLCEFCNTQADPGKMTDSTDNGNVKTKTKQKKLNQPLLSMIKDKLIRPTKFNDFTAKTHLSPHSSTEQHKNLSLSAPPPTGTTSVMTDSIAK